MGEVERLDAIEARLAKIEDALVARARSDECGNEPGPCKAGGRCKGCVYAHLLGEKPCEGHSYSGCGALT